MLDVIFNDYLQICREARYYIYQMNETYVKVVNISPGY